MVQARYVLAAMSSAAYVAGSQWLMLTAPTSPWSAVALLVPMLGVACAWMWQSRQRLLSACAAGAILYLLVQAGIGSPVAAESLYVLQHVVIHLGLGYWFGSTLRQPQTPLITALAQRVHKLVTPAMRAYTRKLTLAWAIYFVVMAGLSLALFAWAPFDAWATFANLLTPMALGLMFGGEYLLRYRLHPDFERVSMLDAVKAYWHQDTPQATNPVDSRAP